MGNGCHLWVPRHRAGALGQCGLIKEHPSIPAAAFQKVYPRGFPSLLGSERDISVRPKFSEVYKSFLVAPMEGFQFVQDSQVPLRGGTD